MMTTPRLCAALLFLAIAGCTSEIEPDPDLPSRCDIAFERDRGCGASRLFGVSFCEGAEAEAEEAGCEAEFQTMLDCHVDEDPVDCHPCDASLDDLLACSAETECQVLYYQVDEGCLDRAIEWGVSDCDDYVTDPATAPCGETMLRYARCKAELPFVDADQCDEACVDELVDWFDCEETL